MSAVLTVYRASNGAYGCQRDPLRQTLEYGFSRRFIIGKVSISAPNKNGGFAEMPEIACMEIDLTLPIRLPRTAPTCSANLKKMAPFGPIYRRCVWQPDRQGFNYGSRIGTSSVPFGPHFYNITECLKLFLFLPYRPG